MKKVYVVTRPDLGWDCVVAVYYNVSTKKLLKEYPEPDYVIKDMTVETEIQT